MSQQVKAEVIKIETPERFLLDGLWFGKRGSRRVLIFVHGLGGSLFSQIPLIGRLLGRDGVAVLAFNNRGSGVITRVKRLNPQNKKGYDSFLFGRAHEVFADCVDDIAGAVKFATKRGAKEIILIGHSTGCQKSVFYLSQRRPNPSVKGAILLAPISDYNDMSTSVPRRFLKAATKYARALVKQGIPHMLLPTRIWPDPIDAQRFLSLYTPESIEEIFCYTLPAQNSSTLKKAARYRLFAVFAGKDEHSVQPPEDLVSWFKKYIPAQHMRIVSAAMHNFGGCEKGLGRLILGWVRGL